MSRSKIKKIFLVLILVLFCKSSSFAYDFNKQQQKVRDFKGNTVWIAPNYKSYAERNEQVSEKIVAIYDKKSPAYGYRYVLYTPIGHYVGHHKIMQQVGNSFEPIPDGGEGSETPCFKTIQEAKHFYYPEWY